MSIEHIGSTAVPGLAAKPIIDVLVTVSDLDDDTEIVAAMQSVGMSRASESQAIACSAPRSETSMSISGATQTQRSSATSGFVTDCVGRRRIVSGMKSSSASLRHAIGATCRNTPTPKER